MKQELFVTCPRGLEDLLHKELCELGLHPRKGVSGVYLPRTMHAVYLVNYCSRIATRVLWPILNFRCPHKEALYRGAREIDWTELLNLEKTFSIDANVVHPTLNNSLFASLVVKDAICDTLREKFGERSSINTKNPDVQLNLYIFNGFATISLDTSGAPLYKRGWREQTGEAPIQESLAATVLALSEYTVEESLCDPFCGSGTMLVEAAMIATQTPPGFFRERWGFSHHPSFSQTDWEAVKQIANAKRIPLAEGKLFGADKDPEAIAMCKMHLAKLGCADVVDLQRRGINSYAPFPTPSLIVTNPPYGKRLHTSMEYFRALGELAKKTRTCLLAPDSSFIKATERCIQKSFPLVSGGLKLSLFQI
jgi:putative N6-adenine-specific DNA methylase